MTEKRDNSPLRENDVAVVGFAACVPGARNVDELWANLRAGRETITFFSAAELREAGVDPARLARSNYVKANAVLADADRFEAEFFGYTPREAELLDVQHRVFLECAWTALEHAGYDPLATPGAFGVFAGAGLNTYLLHQIARNPEVVGSAGGFQILIANDKDFLASRVSYKLNLRGPSIAVQTACSTSLVAVHLAIQSLLAGECDAALAGGVSIRVPQVEGYEWQEGMILSPDGHCRPFDAAAAGTIGGNGAGLVVLKRLGDAVADHDTIHAIIRGSAVNNDGAAKVGYTAPSVEGQEAVIAEALAVAGVAPDEIGYVEAHGTGTTLGDPIEVAALTRAFRRGTARRQYCALGAVKSNLGHLDAAAGVVGLIKAVLAVKHGEIPPSLHFRAPNPQIDFGATPFRVVTALEKWVPPEGARRRAGVSSFGIGGTNAHVIVEQSPAPAATPVTGTAELLLLSARTEAALAAAARSLGQSLDAGAPALDDVAYTLAVGRRAFPVRHFVVAGESREAAARLRREFEPTTTPERAPRVAFLFPGQGTQYPGMAAGLYQAEPKFRLEIDRCAEILRPHLEFDARSLMFDAQGDPARLARTDIAQPILFALSYSLARWWETCGLRPHALLGHSIGEWVAACLAEVFTLEEALRLVVARGHLMAAQPAGGMLAVGLAEPELRPDLVQGGLDIAAINAPRQTVVAGPEPAITALEHELSRRGVATSRLQTSHAYHSAMMEPAARALEAEFMGIPSRPAKRRWISNVTGSWIDPVVAADPAYWMRHLRSTVRFADAIATLRAESDLLLEVGAGRTLIGLAERQRASTDTFVTIPSLRGGREAGDDGAAIREALGRLWSAGATIEWGRFYAGRNRHRVPLPTYPFAGDRYWIEAVDGRAAIPNAFDKKPDVADWFYLPSWRRTLALSGLPSVTQGDWLVVSDVDGVAERLAARLRGLGATVSILDRDAPPTFGSSAPRWIVSLRELRSEDDGIAALDRLCDLGRALGEAGLPRDARLIAVVTGVHAFAGEQVIRPTRALLHGPVRVLPNEVPGLDARLVDVVPPTPMEVDALIESLITEARGGNERFISLRGRERWAQGLEPVRVTNASAPALRGRGVYLITGGHGGIGSTIAEDFFRRAKARLVLLARSTPSAAAQSRIDRLRDLGAEVMVSTADVADESALLRVRDEIRARFGGCNGIVHAAGIAGGGALVRRTAGERAAVLRPKVQGTLALDRVFADENLDFLALMSSLTAQLGEFGQSDYAAANAFLDAFAAVRRSAGRPFVSIGWDAWRDVGMAARQEATGALASWLEREKCRRISDEEGCDVLQRALASGAAHLVVSTVDLARRELAGSNAAKDPVAARSDRVGSRPRRPRPPTEPFLPPTTEMESKVAAVWTELLGVDEVGANDDFFALGGHSLLATQVIARLRDLGAQGLTLATFFETPTVAGLARRLTPPADDEPALAPIARDRPLALSFAQQSLWVMDRMEGRSAHFNEFGGQRIRGALDLECLRGALHEVICRHEVLRTRFVEQREGVAQEIEPTPSIELEVVDGAEGELPERAAELARQTFDLARGPLLRARLVRLAPEDHVLMIVVHHIVFDGWSSAIFFREMITMYGARVRGMPPELPRLPVQYADFAAWQRRWLTGHRRKQGEEYWRTQLGGALPVLALPTDRRRPAAQCFRGRRLAFTLGAELARRLERRGRERGASLFMTLLAGYAAVLGRTAAQEDVIIGCPSAGRDRSELAPLIGFFINPLPMRVKLAGDPTLAELIERVRATVVAAYAHAALPFEHIVEAVHPPRDPARSPIFQAMLVFQNDTGSIAEPPGLKLSPWTIDEVPARSDLDLYGWETPDGLDAYFVYNADLFDVPTVQRLAARLRSILEVVASNPETTLAQVRFETSALPPLASRRAVSPPSYVPTS